MGVVMFAHSLIHRSVTTILAITFFALSLTTSADSFDDNDNLFQLTIEELMAIDITVASHFKESQLAASASIEVVNNLQWQSQGVKTVSEAIGHLPSVMTHQVPWGGDGIAIRGYSSTASVGGIAVLLDGIPLNNIFTGSGLYETRSFNLPSLNRIELIKGPGSSLYGSDAFHGVLSLKTYQSQAQQTEVRFSLDSERYKQISVNHSQHLADGYHINASLTATDQPAQDIPFTFTNPFTLEQVSAERDNSYDAYMGLLKLDIEHSKKITSDYGIYILGSDNDESPGAGQSQSPFGSVFGTQDKTLSKDKRVVLTANFTMAFTNNYHLESKSYFWRLEKNSITDLSSFGLNGIQAIQKQKQTGVDLVVKQTENSWNTQWALGMSYKNSTIIDSQVAQTQGLTRVRISPLVSQQESGFNRAVKTVFYETKTNFFDDRLTHKPERD